MSFGSTNSEQASILVCQSRGPPGLVAPPGWRFAGSPLPPSSHQCSLPPHPGSFHLPPHVAGFNYSSAWARAACGFLRSFQCPTGLPRRHPDPGPYHGELRSRRALPPHLNRPSAAARPTADPLQCARCSLRPADAQAAIGPERRRAGRPRIQLLIGCCSTHGVWHFLIGCEFGGKAVGSRRTNPRSRCSGVVFLLEITAALAPPGWVTGRYHACKSPAACEWLDVHLVLASPRQACPCQALPGLHLSASHSGLCKHGHFPEV